MTDKPPIEECIAWHEIETKYPATKQYAKEVAIGNATIAYLRDYARLKAERDDPRVVRVPKQEWDGAVAYSGMGTNKANQAIEQVAAWDKEREHNES